MKHMKSIIMVLVAIITAGAMFMGARHMMHKPDDRNVRIQTCWIDSDGHSECSKPTNGVIAQ